MPRVVWTSTDGGLYNTEKEAVVADVKNEIRECINKYQSDSKYGGVQFGTLFEDKATLRRLRNAIQSLLQEQ